jgi:NhaP-type Na+/H+ and K+/H+ antiporter
MKIKKFKQSNKNDKFIKLKTLKLYSKAKQTNIQKIVLQTHLIKICNIIYQYHLLNKKILFLGFPTNFKNIFKKTEHKIIPESLLFNGVISNKKSLNNTIKTKIKNIDLIIVHNQNNYSTVEKESYAARIPTITLHNKQKFNNKTAYPWLSNYKSFNEKKVTNNFFLIFLKNTLLKAKQSKTIVKAKTQYYLPFLLRCSKEDRLFNLSKLHQTHGLYVLYELIYELKKYNKYE